MDYSRKAEHVSCLRKTEIPLSAEALLEITEAILEKKTPVRFQGKGFSMTPFIKDGDLITIAPLEGRNISVGDIVAAGSSSRNRLIVHRVVEARNDRYILKGDMCFQNDGAFTDKEILGRVVRIEDGKRKKRMGTGIEKRIIAVISRNRVLFTIMAGCAKYALHIKDKIKKKPQNSY